MRNRLFRLLPLVLTVPLAGCVQRTLHIESDPSGALVHLNDVEVGRTPVDVDFTFYGVYDVLLEKEGYEPLRTSARAQAPWYDAPLLDLVGAVVPPGRKEVDIRWSFQLEPVDPDPEAVVARARELRERVGGEPLPDGQAPPPLGEPIRIEPEPTDEPELEEPELPPLTPDPVRDPESPGEDRTPPRPPPGERPPR